MSSVNLHIEGPVARLTIDNPGRRNAMSRAMWRSVPALTAQARAHPAVRLLVLQSATPGAFCAGADISEFESTHSSDEESRRSAAEIAAAIDALADFDLPTLALIDGTCIGGGMALVLGCDIRLATSRSTFSITPAKLGLSYHPDDIARLYRLCGPAITAEFLFAAQMWPASRCVECGLLNHMFDADDFEGECRQLLGAIAGNSLDAQLALKRGIAAAASASPEAIARAEIEFAALFAGRDFIEGRSAFLAKRPAVFPSHRS